MSRLPAFQTTEATIDRRRCLQTLGGGLGSLGLAQALSQAGHATTDVHPPPRAKRIIQLFMNGGPFAPDLIDPKPALEQYAGQRPDAVQLRTENATGGLLPSPFAFRPAGASGLPVSELLPEFAGVVDDVCYLNGLYTDNPNHGPALLLMNNGTILPTRPSMGSWLSYGLGSENENLPTYVVLCPGRPVRFKILWTSAFLPAEHQGTYINHSDDDPDRMIPYLSRAENDPESQRRMLDLLQDLGRYHSQRRDTDPQLNSRLAAMETAYRMQTEASDAFDLSQESQTVVDQYGDSHFARGCLLARRLIERGVRMVQVYYGNGQPWDTHRDHTDTTRRLAAEIDRPQAALLRDLKQRGLLDETLVVWGGEFGRTPTSENGAGRDHNHYGFSMWLAGGGVRGGMRYGATDEFGFRSVSQRMHVHDLHATLLHLLGIDHRRLTYRYAGRDFRLTDVHGRVVTDIVA